MLVCSGYPGSHPRLEQIQISRTFSDPLLLYWDRYILIFTHPSRLAKQPPSIWSRVTQVSPGTKVYWRGGEIWLCASRKLSSCGGMGCTDSNEWKIYNCSSSLNGLLGIAVGDTFRIFERGNFILIILIVCYSFSFFLFGWKSLSFILLTRRVSASTKVNELTGDKRHSWFDCS